MARPFTFGGIELDVNAGQTSAVAEAEPLELKPEAEDPFRILVLGDFSGRGSSLKNPLRIDRDNLDEVMRALHVETGISLGDRNRLPVPLKFEALEHFEPDSLFERCELFRALDNTKEATNADASKEENFRFDLTRLSSGSLLDAIVEQQAVPKERAAAKPVPQSRADREERLNVLMRAILHEPRFQALEAAWRSLDFLVRNIESEDRIKIYVFDLSKERLAADLLQNPEFRSSDTYRVIVEDSVRRPGAEPWAVIIGNYAFDRNSSSDVELLTQIGLLARTARAPFLAEVVPSSRDDRGAFESWQALRESSHASWIGLAIPRLLLRLPYGKETASVESFYFEEVQDSPQHEEYLWGNPAFGCAYLLALSFARFGWDFRPGMHREIAGLPLHIYKEDGATLAQPCAEVLLTESDWNALLDQGLMPMAGAKDADWVRLVRFQSIAEPPTALSGRWL